MDSTFTGRGVRVTDEIRVAAEHKLARLERLEPRAMRLDVELMDEHHPRLDGLKRVEAALRIPRKTFRAHAEADDVPTAIDRVATSSSGSSAIITARSGSAQAQGCRIRRRLPRRSSRYRGVDGRKEHGGDEEQATRSDSA